MKVFRNYFMRVIYKSLKTTVGSVWKKYNEVMEKLGAVREHRTDEVGRETTACVFISKKDEVPDDGA